MSTTDEEKIKACPKCGTTFSCSPTDCWCSKLPPVVPMIENAACYCPTCLGELIAEVISN